MNEMAGFMTEAEGISLLMELSSKTEEERKELLFVLFVSGRGMLNGQEAYTYLKEKYNGGK